MNSKNWTATLALAVLASAMTAQGLRAAETETVEGAKGSATAGGSGGAGAAADTSDAWQRFLDKDRKLREESEAKVKCKLNPKKCPKPANPGDLKPRKPKPTLPKISPDKPTPKCGKGGHGGGAASAEGQTAAQAKCGGESRGRIAKAKRALDGAASSARKALPSQEHEGTKAEVPDVGPAGPVQDAEDSKDADRQPEE